MAVVHHLMALMEERDKAPDGAIVARKLRRKGIDEAPAMVSISSKTRHWSANEESSGREKKGMKSI